MLAALTLALSLQAPPPPGIDEYKVDAAIKKGVAWLKQQKSPNHGHGKNTSFFRNSDELILLTLLHANVPENDPKLQELFKRTMKAPLERTYKVALLAMFLEDFDRVKYQRKLWQCAQFLVDNQCQNGQWSYGNPTPFVKNAPELPDDVATGGAPQARSGGVLTFNKPPVPGERVKPKVVRRLGGVRKQKEGRATGDNSNTQYGALGLRSCHDAGIIIPAETVVKGLTWWRLSQHRPDPKEGVYGGRGWNYKDPQTQDKKPYHAMTAGGVGSLAIYEYMLKKDWKRSTSIKAGLKWIGDHWYMGENYYYLYGLERACVLYGTEEVGKHNWYVEGAKFLLKKQKGDGAWRRGKYNKDQDYRAVWDTCFAILFLRRATRPLVESVDSGR